MRWLTILVAVLGLALVGAGCGGGDDEAADDEATVTITTDTTEAETTETETTDGTETETSGSIGNLTEDCLAAVAAFTALAQGVGAAGGGNSEGVDEAAETFQEYADRAPDEIRDDIQVLAEAYRTYIAALSDLGLQAGETPSADQLQQLASAAEKLNTPEITAASESFSAWATSNCPR